MDKISVTDASLQNVFVVLQQMNNTSEAIAGKCIAALNDRLESMDSNLRKELQAYIAEVIQRKERFKYCIDENMNAISDRFNKIPDYEKNIYTKRNFV